MIKVKLNSGILFPQEQSSELSKLEGTVFHIEIIKPKRSLQQNKWLWKVFQIIGNEWGYNKDEMKELILRELKHTYTIINKKTGEEILKVKDTHDLSKLDFSDLAERVLQFASEHGLYILTPQEYFET